MTHNRVLIVGAGLAGLALAGTLAEAGLAPQVTDREAGVARVLPRLLAARHRWLRSSHGARQGQRHRAGL